MGTSKFSVEGFRLFTAGFLFCAYRKAIMATWSYISASFRYLEINNLLNVCLYVTLNKYSFKNWILFQIQDQKKVLIAVQPEQEINFNNLPSFLLGCGRTLLKLFADSTFLFLSKV